MRLRSLGGPFQGPQMFGLNQERPRQGFQSRLDEGSCAEHVEDPLKEDGGQTGASWPVGSQVIALAPDREA